MLFVTSLKGIEKVASNICELKRDPRSAIINSTEDIHESEVKDRINLLIIDTFIP